MNGLLHLPPWLDQEAATLAGAIPPADTFDESLPAFPRAVSLTPLQRLQLVQESGITEYGYSGEPVHLAWRRMLHLHRPPLPGRVGLLLTENDGVAGQELVGRHAVLVCRAAIAQPSRRY